MYSATWLGLRGLNLGGCVGSRYAGHRPVSGETERPFDIHSLSTYDWRPGGSADDRRRKFREHLEAIKNRPPIVPVEPLIP
jgi:hypothetical protein